MKLTNLDTDILLAIMDLHSASSTTLAHRLLNPKLRYDTQKADTKIRYRLERMRKVELLEKNGVEYSVNKIRVSLQPATLKLAIGVELQMGMMLVVIPSDGDVQMKQISLEKNNNAENNVKKNS